MQLKPKTWFSIFDFSFIYKGSEPPFIDKTDFPWALAFQENFERIRNELFEYLKTHQPEAYFNKAMVNETSTWKTISLKWWDIEFKKRQAFFPITTKIIQRFPEILSLSFNHLEAGGKILPHCGDTNAIYRCHLGLVVPETLPLCGFRVLDEYRSWKENEWLIFMDAYNHEAYNKSDKERIIMVVDVLRPEFSSQRNKITGTVLTSLFLQKRAMYLPFLAKTPPSIIKGITLGLRPLAALGKSIVNWLKFY